MIKVLCFGTFDGIHDGHRAMLREAKSIDSKEQTVSSINYLTAAVAPDNIVFKLKGRPSRHTQAERIQMLKNERVADEVILADTEVDSWKILKRVKPAIIALGYDQDELRGSLETYLDQHYPDVETAEGEWIKNPKKPRIVILSAYKPKELHNRIRNEEL